MSKRERNTGPQVDLRTLTLTLTVSIFIALLAFFLVLNSFSTNSMAKQKKLQESLSDTFGYIGKGHSVIALGGSESGTAGDAEEAAAAGLRSVLPDVGFQSSSAPGVGQTMIVDIPRSQFTERWPELRGRLGDVLTKKNKGGHHSLQILALDGPSHVNELVPWAKDLLQEGVDPSLISIGYINKGMASIELRFINTANK